MVPVSGRRLSSIIGWAISLLLYSTSIGESKVTRGGIFPLSGSSYTGLQKGCNVIKAHGQAFIRFPNSGKELAYIGGNGINNIKPKLIGKESGIKTIMATRSFTMPAKHSDKHTNKEGGTGLTVTSTNSMSKTGVASSGKVGNIAKGKQLGTLAVVKDALKSFSMLSLWYAGTVMYNVENKKALNMCPLPKSIAALQMLIGIPYFLTRWMIGLRPVPKINVSNEGIEPTKSNLSVLQYIKHKVKNGLARVRNTVQAYSAVLKQSAVFSMLHLLSVTALGAGAISFVHIVRASEPLFVSAISLLTGTGSMSPMTFLTLLPILGGVAMASVKDINFSYLAFAASLASNICASIRRIEAKKFLKQDLSKIGQNLDASNISSLVTIFSSLFLAPLALLESPKWATVYNSLLYKFSNKGLLKLARHIALSGFFYILYTEVSFIALSQLTPVSHAVANTLKRIFLIITSSVFFNTKITSMGLYGSATAITGALLYSLSKQYYG